MCSCASRRILPVRLHRNFIFFESHHPTFLRRATCISFAKASSFSCRSTKASLRSRPTKASLRSSLTKASFCSCPNKAFFRSSLIKASFSCRSHAAFRSHTCRILSGAASSNRNLSDSFIYFFYLTPSSGGGLL